MKGSASPQKTVAATQLHSTQYTDRAKSDVISGLLVILLPVVIVCTIVGYRQQRARLLQQRINRLNRLWQLNISEKLS